MFIRKPSKLKQKTFKKKLEQSIEQYDYPCSHVWVVLLVSEQQWNAEHMDYKSLDGNIKESLHHINTIGLLFKPHCLLLFKSACETEYIHTPSRTRVDQARPNNAWQLISLLSNAQCNRFVIQQIQNKRHW